MIGEIKIINFSYTSPFFIRSVFIVYVVDNQEYVDVMSTTDGMNWTLVLDIHTSDLIYGFLINDLYWMPDDDTELVTYRDILFSVYNSKVKPTYNIELVTGELCKDFSADFKAPLDISYIFTSIDRYICLWIKYDNLLEESLIKIELANPQRQVHITDYQILDNSKKEGIFYCAIPINYTMSSGKWLIYVSFSGAVIFEREFEYRVLNNSYIKGNSSMYHTNLRFDLKG